jgi:antitoxin component of MazEF toxin-antitoxin module
LDYTGLESMEYVTIRRLQKVGGSHCVTLPSAWIKAQGLEESDSVTVRFDDKIVIEAQPVGSGKKAKH